MLKLKVGDKAIVNLDLRSHYAYPFGVADDMLVFRGRIVTISNIATDREGEVNAFNFYRIKEDRGTWAWDDRFLTPVYELSNINSICICCGKVKLFNEIKSHSIICGKTVLCDECEANS